MRILVAALAGVLFGLGLAVSQMMDPAKVLNFLDVAGNWDPSLMLVMGGALAVTLPGFNWVLRRPAPVLDIRFYLPDRTDVDGKLVVGASLFGIGWGLVGLCPGPAIAGLGLADPRIIGFVVMMILGYRIAHILEGRFDAARREEAGSNAA